MRPKITFRDGVPTQAKSTYIDADFARAEDAELDPDLADIILHWRGTYATAAWKPSAQDIKATLHALRRLEDGEIERAYRCLDPWTEAHLWRLPARPSGDEIRSAAREALRKLQHVPNRRRRPPIQANDVQFGVDLVRWWEAHHGKPATVWTAYSRCGNLESTFLNWAAGMFGRAGRHLGGDSLKKPLQNAVRVLRTLESRI